MGLETLLVYRIVTGDTTYPHSGNFTISQAGQVTIDDQNGTNDSTFDDFTDGGSADVADQNVTASSVTGINNGDTIDSRYTYTITGSDGSSGNIWFLATNSANNYGPLIVTDFVLDPSVTYTFGTFNRQGQNPYSSLVPCFVAGTLVDLVAGPKPVEHLRPGDEVFTLDAGNQPVQWIGRRTLDAIDLAQNPKLAPIHIAAGALGPNVPERDLYLSPQHRVLVRSRIARRMFDADEVLVPAIKLTRLNGVSQVQDCNSVTYVHILFDRHQIVRTQGVLSESLHLGDHTQKCLSDAARAELETLFPQMFEPEFAQKLARPVPNRPQAARKLVERHAANGRALQ